MILKIVASAFLVLLLFVMAFSFLKAASDDDDLNGRD